MADEVVTELEKMVNGDILSSLKKVYDKVVTIGVPIEQGVASHLRTLLGEAHNVVTTLETAGAVGSGSLTQQAQEVPHSAPDGGELSPEAAKALSDLSNAYEEARQSLIAAGSQSAAQDTQATAPAIGAGGAPGGSA